MNERKRFLLAAILVALTGFISLSYELLWIRLYSFVSASRAWAFGALLGTYLIGLALGSLWSLRYQGEGSRGQGQQELRALAGFVALANALGFLVIPIVSWLVTWIHYGWTFPIVALAAALLGAALPLICHFSIPADEKVGSRLSLLYLANILGSGFGSLFTGFVLMDRFSLGEISIILAILGMIMALGVSYFSGVRGKKLTTWSAGAVLGALALIAIQPTLFDQLYERLQWKKEFGTKGRFKTVVESRFGVITIDEEDSIYGGGIYDGYLGTELEPESWIVRPYFLSAVHPNPKKILTIGLSGGTWTQILASHPQVEELTAVEINAAYSERVIPQIAATKSILTNPKVNIVIDDGRRWLRRNPDRKFDAIVINMTYHWREHATNLLSQEFMELAKSHLNAGGIFILNATGSARVALTAAEVFTDTNLLLNNVLASNAPLQFDKERWRRILSEYQIDGIPLFTKKQKGSIDQIVSMLDYRGHREISIERRILTQEQVLEDGEGLELITDDNLGEEF